MSKKNQIDKTKENIGISNLDEETKKELFSKFISGGGKIVDEKTKRKNLVIDRQKQKEYQQRIDSHASKINKTARKKKSSKSYVSNVGIPDSEINSLINSFSKFKIKLRLKLLGVTKFNGYYFNYKFLKKFNNIYKTALMELQILFMEIFKKNPTTGKRIIMRLDKAKPIYYELIYMTGNIFDKIISDQVVDHYVNFPDIPQKIPELREPLMKTYKKLYLLYQFENSIINSFNSAINLYSKISTDQDISSASMKRKMKHSIFIIFNKLLPRLHLLFCHYLGTYLDYGHPEIDNILGIIDTERPGNRVANQQIDEIHPAPVEENENPAEEEEEEEQLDDFKTKSIRKGLEIMSRLDLKELRKEFDKSRSFENVGESDKVLMTYILFKEFDKEYSFILTTNKIKFNIDISDRAKSDFAAKLNDLYVKMRKCYDSLDLYAEELKDYNKSRYEKPQSGDKYIEYTKRLETFRVKMNDAGKNALTTVKNYMRKITEELIILINDMDGAQQYIDNPQDVLEFETHIEGEKKIGGRKIFDAIQVVYSYAAAFEYRLNPGGDLSGKIEVKKEKPGGSGSKEPENDKKSTAKSEQEPGTGEDSDEQKEKSILDELNDML